MSLPAYLRRGRPDRSGEPLHLPAHVGVVMDGNRRWARAAGHLSPRAGHRAGAEHLEHLLDWCTSWGIDHVTSYVLSASNISRRSPGEVAFLFELLTDALPSLVISSGRWQLHASGNLALLPDAARQALEDAETATSGRPAHLTLAIGYDGRADIVEGIRGALRAVGAGVDADAITSALPGGPVKEIDLVIRTSGEQRLSGFFPWQAAHAELFFSPKMWPAFAATDFEDALRHFSDRRRRAHGTEDVGRLLKEW